MAAIPHRIAAALALLFMGAALSTAAPAPQSTSEAHPAAIHAHPLPNGIEVSLKGVTLRVTALRDDILRVRATQGGDFPVVAAWAVLPGPRAASVMVTPEDTGFATKALRVSFDSSMRLTVSDLFGTCANSNRFIVSPQLNRSLPAYQPAIALTAHSP